MILYVRARLRESNCEWKRSLATMRQDSAVELLTRFYEYMPMGLNYWNAWKAFGSIYSEQTLGSPLYPFFLSPFHISGRLSLFTFDQPDLHALPSIDLIPMPLSTLSCIPLFRNCFLSNPYRLGFPLLRLCVAPHDSFIPPPYLLPF